MDVPPVQVEVWRMGLQGQPAQEVCRPDPTVTALGTALSGSSPCQRPGPRIRIDQPAGWPVLPPPPVPTLQ
jgi:hypothetical protein